MTVKQLDYTGKINSFLMVRKDGGLATQKMPLYLNLLKFLVSHFSEKDLTIEEIEKPADEIMHIRFEGIDLETQQEYLQLFLDFIGFCKKTALGIEPALAVRREEKARVEQADEVKCPKCGSLQQRSARCVQCGIPLAVVVKRRQYEAAGSSKNKKSTVYLATALIAIFVAAMIYQLFGGSGREKIKDYKQEILVNSMELDSYVESVKKHVKSIKTVESSFKGLNTGKVSWEAQHESVLTEISAALALIRKIKPPAGLDSIHQTMVARNAALVNSLEEVKGDLNSQKGMGSRALRTGRAFSTVSNDAKSLFAAKNKFVATINFVCKYNDSKCRLEN